MTHKKHRLLVGAHVSAAGGLYHAFEHGSAIGCTTIQCFTKSNRQWKAKALSDEEIVKFKLARKQSGISPVVVHASYLINIGSPNHQLAKKSAAALKEELERCNLLDIEYLVLHPGSHLYTPLDTCLERIAHNTSEVLHAIKGSTMILFETMSGQGSTVGYSFEQLAWLIKHTTPHHLVGICLDTCHIFVAGYDFSTPATYKKMWHTFDDIIGRKHLKVIHCNDSVKPLGSHVDRHADIGKGAIGLEAFHLLMNDHTLFDIPKILETPKKSPSQDMHNMKTLMTLLSPHTRSQLIMPEYTTT